MSYSKLQQMKIVLTVSEISNCKKTDMLGFDIGKSKIIWALWDSSLEYKQRFQFYL